MTTALFSDDPQVEELGKAGYDAAVAVGKEKKGGESDPPVVWLVNFYSPSCGHCQRFAPTWRRVGSRYAGTVIRVGAVDCINHRDICQSAGIRAFPTLKAFVPGQGALEIRRGGSPYENIENFVDENHLLDLGAMAGAGSKHVASSLPVLDEAVSQEANAVAQQGNNSASCRMRIVDASSSLKFLLENEVFVGRRSVLSQKERGVLHDLVGDAVRVIPSLQDDMDPILRALENPNRTPTAVQWDALTKGKGEHTWPAVAQEAHRAADDTFNYNAGIWALFHILSLSGFPASRVLSDMEGFAQNFFSCEYCRAHFLTMLDFKDNGLAQVELEGNAPADRATSLWVWRAHNAVTQHNSKEDGILEVHQHLWPSATECSACHHGVTDYGQPIWDEDRVFDYLRYTYGCTDRRASPEHLSSSAGIAGESGSMGGHGIVLWYPLTSLAILMVAIAAIKMKLSSTLASHPKKHGKSHVDPSTGEEGCPSSQGAVRSRYSSSV